MYACPNEPKENYYWLLLFCWIMNDTISVFFFFFERKFQLMASILDDGLYHQTKITIGFWCR